MTKHPRPDFERKEFIILNGKWNFCFDDTTKANDNEKINGNFNDYEINVPFPYQCELSGIEDKTYHEQIWYSKQINIKKDNNKSYILKLGAIDSFASIYINGKHVKDHDGGYSQIDVNISDYLVNGDNTIAIMAKDDRNTDKPRGKQYWMDAPDRCWYSETSGIHRTCWLEVTGKTYIDYFSIIPNIDTNTLKLDMYLSNDFTGKLQIQIKYNKEITKDITLSINNKHCIKEIITLVNEDDIDEVSYWSMEDPNLYEIKFNLIENNNIIDEVSSYFGLRNIEIRNNNIYLNHKPLYQRLILDQGYWEKSLTTPASEEDLIKDLQLIKEMGFNGVRMHQKCEDPLFYYHADKMGLLVWLEMPSSYDFNLISVERNLKQWKEIVLQNINHPSIITYVPINESWGVRKIYNDESQIEFANTIYELTKTIDNSRLISTNDGWEFSCISDIYGFHQYFADPEKFAKQYEDFDAISKLGMFNRPLETIKPLDNKPVIISEFGGIALNNKDSDAWGYNSDAKDEKDYKDKIEKQINSILSLDYLCGYCYTQLTDVMQEVNGLLKIDRTPKLPIKEYTKIFSKNSIKYQR